MKKRNGSTYRWRQLRKEILKRDEYRCAYCGHAATQVDHVTSLDKGGTDEPDNLIAACAACNLRKGTKEVKKILRTKIRRENFENQNRFF
jgi:5-methylcytosine-specific restriction endonuclease McrA